MSIVQNERTKLTAAAIDRASTACVTIGVIAPVAAAFYSFGGERVGLRTLIIGTIIWLGTAAVHHLAARHILRGLKA